MPRIIMNRAFIARWTRMPHSTGRLSASASSHHSLSSAAFITNIAESDFRHAHGHLPRSEKCQSRHRHNAAADLLEHFHGCERFSRPRPETVQCELCLLSGLDINKEVVVLLLRRLALPIEVSRI